MRDGMMDTRQYGRQLTGFSGNMTLGNCKRVSDFGTWGGVAKNLGLVPTVPGKILPRCAFSNLRSAVWHEAPF